MTFPNDTRAPGPSTARVTAEFKGAYRVKSGLIELFATITGKQMHQASTREDYPAVGDFVEITPLADDRAVIERILPRRTILRRKAGAESGPGAQIIATNIDVAFVIEAVDRDHNLNRLERYCALARDGGITPAIVLNKTDLIPEEELGAMLREIARRLADTDLIPTTTRSGDGLSLLRRYMTTGKTYCFLGSSGVGKSTLINGLLGDDAIRTVEISSYSGRGKHTTTRRQMYFLDGGEVVIDTPGIREVGMADSAAGVASVFEELTRLGEQCRFADCTHANEPGCMVLAAVREGKLDKDRYDNYMSLKKEAEFYELSEQERREKDRSFGKFVKKAKKSLQKYD